MPEPDPPPTVYQLRVVLREISPLIWPRRLVPSETTLAGLHDALQVAFSWSGEHLYRFTAHGAGFDAYDLAQVRLADLGLRVTERFVYDYDFTDFWCHDLRVEQILLANPDGRYPRCVGGRRAGPPEDCGGPWAFMELSQPYRIFEVVSRAAEIVGRMLDGDISQLGEHREEIAALYPWMTLERFETQAVNRALAGLAHTEASAA
jgi:hypothetical protein